jgi:hypothetical protein
MTDITAGTGPTHPTPTHPPSPRPGGPPPPRPRTDNRTDDGDWGPGGSYNPDNWGCGALLAPLLALVAILLAVTA